VENEGSSALVSYAFVQVGQFNASFVPVKSGIAYLKVSFLNGLGLLPLGDGQVWPSVTVIPASVSGVASSFSCDMSGLVRGRTGFQVVGIIAGALANCAVKFHDSFGNRAGSPADMASVTVNAFLIGQPTVSVTLHWGNTSQFDVFASAVLEVAGTWTLDATFGFDAIGSTSVEVIAGQWWCSF
jgi:hypothetical protein